MNKRTKIVCTIGPASENKTTLEKMFKAGMDVVRLNFSHGNYKQHAILLNNIRAASKKMKKPVAIMQDLQGPRIRIGEVDKNGIDLTRKEKVILIPESWIGKKDIPEGVKQVPLGYANLYKNIKPKNHILINDGLIDIKVELIIDGIIYGTVLKPGIIFSRKGINIPGVEISARPLTDKDKEDLKFGLKQNVDYVAMSFVKNANNIKTLRTLIPKSKKTKIIAKIETESAVDNFDKILKEADGIMVARGDLGIEIQPSRVPLLQKEFIQKCMLAGKPVIVATQMLDSMILNPRPTRAEVSDVANAVIDHTDAVMLSGESAFGKYPVESVKMMAKILERTENSVFDDVPAHYLKMKKYTVTDSISQTVNDLVQENKAKAIIVNSISGRTARMIARHRPETRLIVLTDDEVTQRQMALIWSAEAYRLPACKNLDALIEKSIELCKRKKLVKKGDVVILATGQPLSRSQQMNLTKVQII